jgi:hypothetical protein
VPNLFINGTHIRGQKYWQALLSAKPSSSKLVCMSNLLPLVRAS